MNDSDRDVLRTIIREEVRAAMDEHEANLAVARVRRSAALEELALIEQASFVQMRLECGDLGILAPDFATRYGSDA